MAQDFGGVERLSRSALTRRILFIKAQVNLTQLNDYLVELNSFWTIYDWLITAITLHPRHRTSPLHPLQALITGQGAHYPNCVIHCFSISLG